MRTRKTSVIIREKIKFFKREVKRCEKEIKEIEDGKNFTLCSKQWRESALEQLKKNMNWSKNRLLILENHEIKHETVPSVLASLYIDGVLGYINFAIVEELLEWDIINKSPYSDSFYNDKNISWRHKPLNSLRISDHWNFIAQDGDVHCKTDVELYSGWALGKFDGEKYIILKQY